MERIKYSSRIMLLLILFWITYNSIFGWNALPQSEVEINCDNIFTYSTYLCFIIYLSPLLGIYEELVKKYKIKI